MTCATISPETGIKAGLRDLTLLITNGRSHADNLAEKMADTRFNDAVQECFRLSSDELPHAEVIDSFSRKNKEQMLASLFKDLYNLRVYLAFVETVIDKETIITGHVSLLNDAKQVKRELMIITAKLEQIVVDYTTATTMKCTPGRGMAPRVLVGVYGVHQHNYIVLKDLVAYLDDFIVNINCMYTKDFF